MLALLAALENSAFCMWVRESKSVWAYPTVLFFHTLGMMVLVGASWVIALRLLGICRSISLGPLQTLFPFMWTAFWLNLVSGAVLFAVDATEKATQPLFFAKLAFVVAAVITMVLIRREVYGKSADPVTISQTAKRLATASIFLWVAGVTSGRLLAYIK